MTPLSEADAAAIWQVLVDHAGASADEGGAFAQYMTTDRGGRPRWYLESFGRTGAFYLSRRGSRDEEWHVTCDREDETPERQAVIEKTKAALAELRKEQVG